MTTITTRSGKGSPLTNNEVDANFTNLNDDKAELSGADFTGDISVAGVATIGADTGGEANVLTLKGRTSDNDGYIKFTSSDGATSYAYAGVPSANTLALYTNGFNERLVINSTGIVDIKGAGSASAPSLILAGDDDTGQFRPSANQIAWATGGTERLRVKSSEVVVNEVSADVDFRVESNNNGNMFFVDAGNDAVGIGTNSITGLMELNKTSSGNTLQLLSLVNPVGAASTGAQLWMSGTNATTRGATIEAIAQSTSNNHHMIFATSAASATPAERMRILDTGEIRLGNSSDHVMVDITASNAAIQLIDNNQSNPPTIRGNGPNFTIENGGLEMMRITSTTETVFNEASQDINFRVESNNNTHTLFVNAGLDAVGINETTPNAKLHITTGTNSGTGQQIDLGLDNGSFSNPVAIKIDQIGGSTSDGVYPWDVSIGGAQRAYQFVSRNGVGTGAKVVHASGDSSNVMRTRMEFTNTETTFNEGSRDFDFRVESDNQSHMLFVDAGNDHVNIGTATDFGGVLNVNGGAVFDDATTFDPDTLGTGRIAIGNVNDGGGFIAPGICWGGSGGQNAAIVSTAGVLYLGVGNRSTVDNLESVIELRNTEVTVNQLSADQDFRVESDSNAHGFFLDASTTSVGVNHTSSPGGYAQFAVRFSGSDSNVNTTGVAIQDSGTNSNISFCTFFNSTGGGIGSITRVGTTNAVAYNTTSDRRAKENIADADDAGAVIDAIQVRKFDWIEGNQHQPYGMIAQELVEHAPEVVHQPADEEDMMGVDYSKLVPMLVKEIQSLRARVAQLESN